MPDIGGNDDRDIDPRQPDMVCLPCAEREGGDQNNFPQWIMAQCDACGRKTAVTPSKYFGGFNHGWESRIQRLFPPDDEAS